MDDLTWIKIEKMRYIKEHDQILHNVYIIGFDKNQLYYMFGSRMRLVYSSNSSVSFDMTDIINYSHEVGTNDDFLRLIWVLISPSDYKPEGFNNFRDHVEHHEKEDQEIDYAYILESLLTHAHDFDKITINQNQKEILKKITPLSRTPVTKMLAKYFFQTKFD